MVKSLDWREVAPHPSCILAAGGREEGKSVLAGTYIDYGVRENIKVFSVGRKFPHTSKKNIDFEPPPNSITILDDAHLLGVYAHDPSGMVKVWDFIQRQKRHGARSVFWTTQDTTGFTLRLLRMMDAICLFRPDMMLYEYERPVMKVKFNEAKAALGEGDQKGRVWIQWQDEFKTIFKDVYSFPLPKWWTEEISTGQKFSGKSKSKTSNSYEDNIFVKFFKNVGKLAG